LAGIAFRCVGLDYKDYVISDPKFFRPQDDTLLVGDSSKAKRVLGWEPEVTFPELIEMMVKADLERNAG